MRATRILQGAAYATRGAFADPLRFVRHVFGETANCESTLPDVSALVGQVTVRLQAASQADVLDQSVAADLLKLRDLERVSRTMREWVRPEDLGEERLHASFPALRGALESSGILLGDVRFSVRESFPAPYDTMDFWAMNYDVSDHEAFGIDPGVVLKRDWLMPLYSPTLLAHELIHSVLSRVRADRLARGFEEGLADMVGALWLSSHLLPMELCENMLVNSRLQYPQGQFWRGYADALRQASTFCLTAGWGAVMAAIRKGNKDGRGVIKEIEQLLIRGDLTKLEGASPEERQDIARFARRFLAFPEQLVVSPLAYVLAERLEVGMTVKELLGENRVSQSAGAKALDELQQRVYLIVLSDGRIVADETKPFFDGQALRYELSSVRQGVA